MSNGTITMTGAEYDALAGKIATLEAENAKLRAELERRAVPDGMMLLTADQVKRHAITARECPPQSRVVLVSSIKRLASKNAAPSAPKADDPVKVQLLEALESAADALARAEFFEQADNARAAISAVREEVMK